MAAHTPIVSITLSCPDPATLAEFYRQATGWETIFASDDTIYLGAGDGRRVGFDRTSQHTPPAWSSDGMSGIRLDLAAENLAADEERLLALGASRPGHDFDTDQWIFMADPAGYPFSLTTVY